MSPGSMGNTGSMGITGATRVTGVIGDPVTHSLSPALHNAAFAALGLDWVSVPFPVSAGRGAQAVEAMRTVGLAGLSVTTPHKDAVAQAADEVSDAVAALGAANCLVASADGRVRAENTDGDGFLGALLEDADTTVQEKTVAVLGAGGAARAISRACADAGAAGVLIVNRTTQRAEVCAGLAGSVGTVAQHADIPGADIVVNATTVGMAPDSAMPCDPALLHRGQIVLDIVYNPSETVWLAAARAAGIRSYNGGSMLVHQAAVAIAHWTGHPAPVDAMRSALQTHLS
ncbi:MAG: shikimate dehydrogenase [Acidimicrobiaceae bacterium]|nr:shikimate dehydrogenase [Acidimicrobiaceae bacterium]MYC41291.1 shikimate dehydrogenase [Acidimicrobiaceae bacterium]MYC43717.1 shikimate dehydrogenase [Acidimicrobiaceae bacterium]